MTRSPARGSTHSPATLLPHGPPALFVEEVLARDAEGIVCRARIAADSPWAAGPGGAVSAVAGLEIAAQAAAWMEALERAEADGEGDEAGSSGPRIGYLVRVRGATLGAAIPAGAAVTARVTRTGGVAPLAIYSAEVTLDDEADPEAALVCRGTLGTYLTGDTIAQRPNGG